MTMDDQQPTMHGQPGVSVGHENLRVVVTFDKPHPTREFSSRQRAETATNVMAGYT